MQITKTAMRSFSAAAFLVVAAMLLAKADDDKLESHRIDFVVGNVMFVLLHEFSHLIIEDFEVPVLGNSEDAADTLAAVTLIRWDRVHPARDFRMIRALLTAADGNRILWNQGLEQDNPVTYLARHPLSVQRAARIACLAYGSDMDLLEPLPEIVGLPEFRSFWCDEEYEKAEEAWLWVRDNYVRESTGTANDHKVVYGPTDDPDRQAIRDWLIEYEGLERIIARAEDSILLPEAMTLLTKSCGSPDGYWDPNERELVICYELIEAFLKLSENESMRELEERIREFHRGEDTDSDEELQEPWFES